MKKKLLAMLLSVAMVSALVGCGSAAETTEPAATYAVTRLLIAGAETVADAPVVALLLEIPMYNEGMVALPA